MNTSEFEAVDLASELDQTRVELADAPLALRYEQVRVARKQAYLRRHHSSRAGIHRLSVVAVKSKRHSGATTVKAKQHLASKHSRKGMAQRGLKITALTGPRHEDAYGAEQRHSDVVAERTVLVSERIGRVRDVDVDREVFLAILAGREAHEPELEATLPLSLIDPSDLQRLTVGAEFTFSTTQRVVSYNGQTVRKPGLHTSVVLHRHIRLPQFVVEQARAAGRAARAALKAS